VKERKLGDVCKVVSGSTPKRAKPEYWCGTIPWVAPKEISNLSTPYLHDSVEKITDLGFKSCSTAMLPTGSLLLSSRAPIGLLAINTIPVCTNQGFKNLVPSDEIHIEYLYYYLKHNIKALQARGNGATFKELPKTSVENFPVLLPFHLDDQKRIAQLLGKVEGLITQRKQSLQQLDDLLKSVFLEMFLTDLKDEDKYKTITKACDFIDYRGKTPPRVADGIPLINAKCVRRGYFNSERLDFVSDETYKKAMVRGFPKANDVLFTTEGATFGYTCRIPMGFDKFSVGQRLITMVCKDGYQPEVLEFVLNNQYIQKKLSNRLSGSAALGIRAAELVKVAIPFPSPAPQLQFTAIVNKVEGIKSHYQQSLTELENLYGALSQKAFKGELDLTRIPLDRIIDEQSMQYLTPERIDAMGLNDEPSEARVKVRAHALRQCFNAFVRPEKTNREILLDDFWQSARDEGLDAMGEDGSPFTSKDNDELKKWLFAALKSGKIEQFFDESSNKIMLRVLGIQS
jgi:type I restriction enzyme, S subunit